MKLIREAPEIEPSLVTLSNRVSRQLNSEWWVTGMNTAGLHRSTPSA
jgi:hypothetical protein